MGELILIEGGHMNEIKFKGSVLHVELENISISTEIHGQTSHKLLNRHLNKAKEASKQQPDSIFWKEAIRFIENKLR